MRRLLVFLATVTVALTAAAKDAAYVESIEKWRQESEQRLKRDNGWLTLAGRYEMKPGSYTIGTAKDNAIVFPAGLGPEQLGTLVVDDDKAVLKLADGVTMTAKGEPFSGERVMQTEGENRDWVSLGRVAFHIIKRDNLHVLRLADNESEHRKSFAGRVWYEVKEPMKVTGRFVPYKPAKTLKIIDIIDRVNDAASPGYVEFTLNGKKHRLDAVAEPKDNELFIIMKDQTAGKGTYNAGRFLVVDWPQDVREKGGKVTIDFNKTYNPPCAFSEFTTCPLPPKQNVLTTKIEAGEKYRGKSG